MRKGCGSSTDLVGIVPYVHNPEICESTADFMESKYIYIIYI